MDHSSSWCSPIIYKDAVILAAGASTRMRRPKALLSYCEEESFLEHIVGVYRRAGFRIVLVMPPELQTELEGTIHLSTTDVVVINNRRDLGRMHSVRMGLANVRDDAHVVIQDVDRPFVTEDLLRTLCKGHTTFGYTVPMFAGEAGHPMLCSPFVAQSLREDLSPTLREALMPFHRREIPWLDLRCGANINYPSDYTTHFPEISEIAP